MTEPSRIAPVSQGLFRRVRRLGAFLALSFPLGACQGPQSTLNVAGREAAEMADLLWVLLVAAAIIWVLVLGTALFATKLSPAPVDARIANVMIVVGGVLFPTAALGGLVGWTMWTMADLRTPDSEGMRIAVSGEQWWWRVAYLQDGVAVPSANEIRVPAGETVTLELTSPDVIHSFWIPAIAGKMDMIPGRTNELVLEPTTPGIYRGQCAEYCGTSHALMAFSVVVMEPAEFSAWLREQAEPAVETAETRGAELFLLNGCGACHAVRGTEADGRVGPDLTHVASRLSLGAGILPVTEEALAEWVAHTREIKPDARMPPYDMLPAADIAAIASYLASLE